MGELSVKGLRRNGWTWKTMSLKHMNSVQENKKVRQEASSAELITPEWTQTLTALYRRCKHGQTSWEEQRKNVQRELGRVQLSWSSSRGRETQQRALQIQQQQKEQGECRVTTEQGRRPHNMGQGNHWNTWCLPCLSLTGKVGSQACHVSLPSTISFSNCFSLVKCHWVNDYLYILDTHK